MFPPVVRKPNWLSTLIVAGSSAFELVAAIERTTKLLLFTRSVRAGARNDRSVAPSARRSRQVNAERGRFEAGILETAYPAIGYTHSQQHEFLHSIVHLTY